jgi:hypothetical protein
MRIAIFSPFVLWTRHYCTDLELIQQHLDAGDQVTILVCNGELPTCDVNTTHNDERCLQCVNTRGAGLRLLSKRVTVQSLLNYAQNCPSPDLLLTDFSTINELKQYRIEDFDIGYAVLSSLISHLRESEILLSQHAELVQRMLRTSYAVYHAFGSFLQRQAVDRVYVFNPRFAPTRGVLRACQKYGVPCFAHDRGHDLQHYELYPNTLPHDREFVDQSIRQLWLAAAQRPDREVVASRWFEDKARGIERKWHSFVAGQTEGMLPPNWDSRRHNIVAFISSEDEFAAIGEGWENPIYATQLEGLRRVIESLHSVSSNHHLYVRIHPNLAGVENQQTRELTRLQAPSLTIIPADAPISTYALLKNAEKVLTFGSTVGIEAVYWGIPSILAGISYYRDLGGTYNPATHEELMQLLMTDLSPQTIEPALMFGYYFSTYGQPFQHFQSTGVHDGLFKGQPLRLRRRFRAVVRMLWHMRTWRQRLAPTTWYKLNRTTTK